MAQYPVGVTFFEADFKPLAELQRKIAPAPLVD
jgi:hypothetical protein